MLNEQHESIVLLGERVGHEPADVPEPSDRRLIASVEENGSVLKVALVDEGRVVQETNREGLLARVGEVGPGERDIKCSRLISHIVGRLPVVRQHVLVRRFAHIRKRRRNQTSDDHY